MDPTDTVTEDIVEPNIFDRVNERLKYVALTLGHKSILRELAAAIVRLDAEVEALRHYARDVGERVANPLQNVSTDVSDEDLDERDESYRS